MRGVLQKWTLQESTLVVRETGDIAPLHVSIMVSTSLIATFGLENVFNMTNLIYQLFRRIILFAIVSSIAIEEPATINFQNENVDIQTTIKPITNNFNSTSLTTETSKFSKILIKRKQSTIKQLQAATFVEELKENTSGKITPNKILNFLAV